LVAPSVKTGSGLALQLPSGDYGTNALVSTFTDNFGLELWVKPDATNAASVSVPAAPAVANGSH